MIYLWKIHGSSLEKQIVSGLEKQKFPPATLPQKNEYKICAKVRKIIKSQDFLNQF